MRFATNLLSVSNCIFAGSTGYQGYYSNQTSTSQPSCSMNNYFNALNFYTVNASITNQVMDISSNYTTLDPGFADPTNGDFTISNADLINDEVGDPRWY
ncbi:MAG: DUF5123 domain-containing protein [Chloroflexia bacterium]|nr:DUF5123 domain-containing protein [Chloroflexia bacterium]